MPPRHAYDVHFSVRVTSAELDALRAELAALREALADLQLLIEQGDAARLEALFTRASTARRRMAGGEDRRMAGGEDE